MTDTPHPSAEHKRLEMDLSFAEQQLRNHDLFKPTVLMTKKQFERLDPLTDGDLGRSVKKLEEEVAKPEPFSDWFRPPDNSPITQ